MTNKEEINELEIFKKAIEIYEIVKAIADLIPQDNEILQDIKSQILTDAVTLRVKIAGAEAADIYDIRMENAAIIRKCARELMIANHSLRDFGFKEYQYYDIVREKIEEFRLLFIDWVNSFDITNYIIDRWGLFNPPGVGPHDHDPYDDIPFDPDDFFDSDDDGFL
jgi:hypothetical protein